MSDKLETLCEKLTDKIKATYESGVTLEEAERLAAEFLYAQLTIAAYLQNLDLDARMKKSGYKAVAAAVYMAEATKTDKKPSDTLLQNLVEMSTLVQAERKSLDEAEVKRDLLQNQFNIFKEAHIYFRGIAKGRFE